MRLPPEKEENWPHLLSEGYDVTSAETWDYNCIAYAADVLDEWWWPDENGEGKWPLGAKREETKEAFLEAYKTLGYEECGDGSLEEGFEKIAIYFLNGAPTHAAKQLPDGKWKSKLGPWEDIEHNSLRAVEEYIYGHAEAFMKRRRS